MTGGVADEEQRQGTMVNGKSADGQRWNTVFSVDDDDGKIVALVWEKNWCLRVCGKIFQQPGCGQRLKATANDAVGSPRPT